MNLRAKFVVTEKREHHWNRNQRTVILTPHYDQSIPEDRRFLQATPSGRFEMQIDNPAALEALEMGKAFYLDLIPVEDPKPVVENKSST
jgi:hypothetical protein